LAALGLVIIFGFSRAEEYNGIRGRSVADSML